MLIPFLVFIVVTVGLLGGYAAAMHLPERLAARRLDRRLQEVSSGVPDADPASPDESVLKHTPTGPFPALDRLLASTGAGGHVARLIERSGVRITPSAVGVYCLVAAVVAAGAATYFIALWALGFRPSQFSQRGVE